MTRERLAAALRVIASIVAQSGGEIYLPIFERLEREVQDFEGKRAAIDRARAVLQAGRTL